MINIYYKSPKLSSFILGNIAGLAFSPIYFFVLSFLCFPLFITLVDKCENKREAFIIGGLFGLGYFLAGLYWISFALFTDFKSFWWLFPFALFGIPFLLSFYIAFVSLIMKLSKLEGIKKVIFFSSLWTVFELLRGYLFTGFPWNLSGYVWTFSDSILQITSIIGIYGLSFFTVLAFSGFYFFNRKKKYYMALLALPLMVIFIYGNIRLSNAKNEFYPDNVRIVQGNISQFEKWNQNKADKILQKYINLSKNKLPKNTKYIIWPESAVPYPINKGSYVTQIIQQAVPKNGLLITGSVHSNISELGTLDKIWNSMHIIDSDGTIREIYNKHHLVPFGEYIPFKNFLPIEKITAGAVDFSEGEGVRTLKIADYISFSPLICYEAIFANNVINSKMPPQIMINVTNDGWYGNSSGPYQHLNMVKVRSVETGIGLIRAANTGISAIIDPYGRIIKKAKYGIDAVIDSKIPKGIGKTTIYTKYGNVPIMIILVLSILICFIKKPKLL